MKTFFVFAFATLFAFAAKAQFVPGRYYDINGQRVEGFINRYPSGQGIEKNEGFIEFKEAEKDKPQRLSASMIHGFVIGRDSFTISSPPRYGGPWTKNELDFIQVVVGGPTNLYMMTGGVANTGGGGGGRIKPMISTGIGTGGVGMGGGIGINLGGGGGGGGPVARNAYYYGETTSTMSIVKKETFVEVMTDVMGDEPDVVDKIRDGTFNINNIDGLVKYYNIVVAARAKQNAK